MVIEKCSLLKSHITLMRKIDFSARSTGASPQAKVNILINFMMLSKAESLKSSRLLT